MKTPKRDGTEGWAGCTIHGGVNQPAFEHARWKRRNRESQYKRTIKRLKEENNHLKRTITRLEKEKEQEYHRGHKAGYDLCFARSWF